MLSTPITDATTPNGCDQEQAYPAHLQALQDRLLLFLRDGAWHPLADLADWLAPRLLPEYAVQRYHDSGGPCDHRLERKCGEGQKLVLHDLLHTLQGKHLLAVRSTEAGDEVQVTPWKDERFDIDPQFENLLPRAPDEVRKLEERLLAEGQRDPLVVWQGQRLLLDGHTRFRFFALLGRTCPMVEMAFPDRAAALAWIYDTHYGRRSYSPEMKSYVRGKQYLARKQGHGGARRGSSHHSGNLKTADAVAAEYRTGRNTILRDAAFAAALDKLVERCGDAVRQKVLSRELKWTRGDVQRLAKGDKAAVREIVREALASGKRPRFPAAGADGSPARKAVNLPLDKPVEQVRLLRRLLGTKGLARLHRTLTRFFERHRKPSPS
jgi:hypothetical protein